MLIRDFIFWLSKKKSVTGWVARSGMRHGFAKRFVPGETIADAIAASRDLAPLVNAVCLNHLGESVSTTEEARGARNSYIEILEALESAKIPGNVSIKPTQLGLEFDRSLCESLTLEIADAAKRMGRTIEMDMESSAYTDATIELFEAAQRRTGIVTLAIQSYLKRSEADLERLAPLSPKIRLVKGAYREPAAIAFQKKSDVDGNFCKLLDRLLHPTNQGKFFPAIATHDPKMLDYARGKINQFGLAKDRYEFQMLYGIRRDLQQQLHEQGHAFRAYIPFGSEWCPYFMRRISERPANLMFVLRSIFAEKKNP